MLLLITREKQLREVADAAAELLEGFEHLETELERKTRENDNCILTQQSAQHDLLLCAVKTPIGSFDTSRGSGRLSVQAPC